MEQTVCLKKRTKTELLRLDNFILLNYNSLKKIIKIIFSLISNQTKKS